MNYTAPHFPTSALIIIDVQNDFARSGAPAEVEGTEAILPNIARLLKTYRILQLPVIHIVRLYRPDGSNVDLCRRAIIESGKRIVCPGMDGSEIPGELLPETAPRLDHELLLQNGIQVLGPNETCIYKPRWGAFYQTPLHEYLQDLRVDTLVFCGCNFPNCPRTSIYEASERDYRIVLVVDAISRSHERGLEELRSIGVNVMTVEEILRKAGEPVWRGNFAGSRYDKNEGIE